jgi:hypothetical protein
MWVFGDASATTLWIVSSHLQKVLESNSGGWSILQDAQGAQYYTDGKNLIYKRQQYQATPNTYDTQSTGILNTKKRVR